jgi:hypothetical protein
MIIDLKITTWERVEIPSEFEKEIQEKVKKGELRSTSDLVDAYNCSWGIIPESEEQMIPIENDGQATIQIFENKGDSKPLWENAVETTKEILLSIPLYYTVEKQLDSTGESINGLKDINVYEITNGVPVNVASIETDVENNSVEEIQEYLTDNGFGDNSYEFKLL